jgi:hypothetical protein
VGPPRAPSAAQAARVQLGRGASLITRPDREPLRSPPPVVPTTVAPSAWARAVIARCCFSTAPPRPPPQRTAAQLSLKETNKSAAPCRATTTTATTPPRRPAQQHAQLAAQDTPYRTAGRHSMAHSTQHPGPAQGRLAGRVGPPRPSRTPPLASLSACPGQPGHKRRQGGKIGRCHTETRGVGGPGVLFLKTALGGYDQWPSKPRGRARPARYPFQHPRAPLAGAPPLPPAPHCECRPPEECTPTGLQRRPPTRHPAGEPPRYHPTAGQAPVPRRAPHTASGVPPWSSTGHAPRPARPQKAPGR